MADVIVPIDVVAGEPTEASSQNAQNDAIATLASNFALVSGSNAPLNGSYEFDFDTDGEPDEWTVEDFSGGSHALDTTNDLHGAQALACTTTVGGGWVQATSDQFVECAGGIDRIELILETEVQTASQRVRAQILWYDAAQTTVVGTSSIFDSTVSVGTIRIIGQDIAPSSARYYKVRLIAGESGGSTASLVIFDGVRAGPFRGFFPSNQSITIAGTGLVSLATQLGNEFPDSVVLQLRASSDSGFPSSAEITVQSWDGSAWQTSGSASAAITVANETSYNVVTVRLNSNRQFNVSAYTAAGSAIASATLVGWYP
jgi:hypothetical protein